MMMMMRMKMMRMMRMMMMMMARRRKSWRRMTRLKEVRTLPLDGLQVRCQASDIP
jgi:hypothetical protein